MATAIKKCPECGGLQLTHNKDKGEVICRSCGLVIEDKMIDFGQEWREFDSDDSDKRRRTGAPMTYSVDYAEPIIIRSQGEIQILPIGKFVDNILAENMTYVKKDDTIEYVPVIDTECVAFDKDYKVHFKKMSEVSRHPALEVYDILLETGKRVKVTGNHSVFTVKNNEVVPIRVDQLQKGKFVVAPKKIPLVEEVKEISLLDEFTILSRKYSSLYLRNFSDEKLFSELKELQEEYPILKGKIKNWKRHNTLPLWTLHLLAGKINIYNYELKDCSIGMYSGRSTLPLKLSLDVSFMRALGFFVAEGTARKNHVIYSFGSHEKEFIKEICNTITQKFHLTYNLFEKETSATQVQFNSTLLSILFKSVLKTGSVASEKRVPSLIFSVPLSLKKAFITSYLQGDGSIVIQKHEGFRPDVCVSTNSASSSLTQDFLLLYSQLGIHANYQEAFISGHVIDQTGQFVKDSVSYRALLKNPDSVYDLGFLNEKPTKALGKGAIETFVPAPQEYKKEWKSRNRIRIDRILALQIAEKYGDKKLAKLAQSSFLFLRIQSIQKVPSTSGYAYDFTVPGYENFVGGRGGIFLHNTKYDRGLGTDVGQKQDIYRLSGKGKNKYFRLRKWQYRISTAIERNLKLALAELKRVASYLKLPKSVEEESARVYTLAVQRGLVRGRSMESVVAGALYAACRRHEVPRTLDELAEASGIDKKEIGRTYRFVTRELGIRILPSNPIDYIPRFASALRLSADTQSKAVEILEMAQNSELTSGRGPTGIAAASLYVAALINNEKRTQREVADIAGVTEVTIRNRYKELLKKLNLKDKIKKLNKEEE